MKTLLLLIFSTITLTTQAQTNVSGGIYANTTWTKANSPYIVTDTIVVFPGVTLTIEPGVVVKFDSSKYMEVRQANIFAEGTITDSITFTSNAVSPAPGMYTFWLNNYPATTVSRFNYCNFHYSRSGLAANGDNTDSLTIRNSIFTYNTVGLSSGGGYVRIDSCNISNNVNEGIYKFSGGTLNYCRVSHNQIGVFARSGTIQNCTIEYNQTGVFGGHFSILTSKINYNQTGVLTDDGNIIVDHCIIDSNTVAGMSISYMSTIMNSEIKYTNGIGIETDGQQSLITMCDIENNITGIKEHNASDSIYCNKICNNTAYDFQYSKVSGSNFSIANNYWCTTDSATIASHIYDGYDNISLGLVNFMPIDSVCSPGILSSVNEITQANLIYISPNPATTHLTITTNTSTTSKIILYDIASRKLMEEKFIKEVSLNIAHLAKGIYLYQVIDERGVVSRGKVVKQ